MLRSGEIASGNVSGGPSTSHTILIESLAALLDALPPAALYADYQRAALEGNALGKQTAGARQRTFRSVAQLYVLRSNFVLFRALRDMWDDDARARPLLAGLCALARDPVFRASSAAILRAAAGQVLTTEDMALSVAEQFPDVYGRTTLASIGRNVYSSWTQTGHLTSGARGSRVRARTVCRPPNVAYALMLGHLQGVRGEALFETLWAQVLDEPKSQLYDLAFGASQRGLIEFRHTGGVVDVSFRELLRPFEGELF